mgnify:CR=1 FL=1
MLNNFNWTSKAVGRVLMNRRSSSRIAKNVTARILRSDSSYMYEYGAMAPPLSTEPANNKNEKGGAEPDLQTTILQRLCWEAYLGSGRGSETLFRSIDVGMTGKVSRTDILQ